MPAASSPAAEDVLVGLQAIKKLKSTDPPLYLSPSEELSKAARLASAYLFSSLIPYTPKSPFSELLVDGFDAEQIWQQIDVQTQPLISSLRRKVRNFEKNPQEIRALFNLGENEENDKVSDDRKKEDSGVESESEEDFGFDDDDDMKGSEEEEKEEEEGDEDEDEDEGNQGKEEDEVKGVEDRFLKIKELEEYLEEDEAREYGLKRNKVEKKVDGGKIRKDDDDVEEEDDDEDEEEEDEDVVSEICGNFVTMLGESFDFCGSFLFIMICSSVFVAWFIGVG